MYHPDNGGNELFIHRHPGIHFYLRFSLKK